MATATVYRIRLKGHLAEVSAEWFEGLTLANEPSGEATLTGPVRDQAELHGLLSKVRDLNLTLIAVEQLAEVGMPVVPPNQ